MAKQAKVAKYFQSVLDNYNNLGPLVNSDTQVYQYVCRKLPMILQSVLGTSESYYYTGSVGKTRTADCPWIAIMNRNITLTTQKGLYIAYLFEKDMSGFYLTLNQGMKNYEDLYGAKKYENARKVAEYYVSQIDNCSFSSAAIDLGAKKGSRGYGYAQGNVLQKHYISGNFNDNVLIADLKELLSIYESITRHMDTASYDQVIKSVLSDTDIHITSADEAIAAIKTVVDPDDDIPFGYYKQLVEVLPKIDRTNKFKRMTQPKYGKIDYLKKAKKDAKAGLLGEELVLKYEKERLASIGLESYVDHIKWISQESDQYGYDIISYDYSADHTVHEIKIEVKTTTSKVDTDFYVSKNELKKSKEFCDSYCVYRVYDVSSEHPKFYKAFGPIDDNFILDPITYMARYKYPNIND